MKAYVLFATFAVSLSLTACNNTPQNQERVRQDTARTTAAIKSDVQAVGDGIRDGLHQNAPASADRVNVNTAGRGELESLPGVSGALADRIIAHRPYADTAELKSKHVLTAAEYDRIAPSVTATH